MIHSSIKASSRSVPERVLFSSVCFPLRRLGRRWGAFPFVTVRIILLISLMRTVCRYRQITTMQSSASQILAVQDICGVPKRSGKYFTITPTSDTLFSSAQELSATKITRSSRTMRTIWSLWRIRMSLLFRRSFGTGCVRWNNRCRRASVTVVVMWQISAVWSTVRTAETKSVLRGTIPQTAVRRSQESIFVTITTALPTWNSESDTVPVTTSKCRIWTLSCLKIFAVSLSSF